MNIQIELANACRLLMSDHTYISKAADSADVEVFILMYVAHRHKVRNKQPPD